MSLRDVVSVRVVAAIPVGPRGQGTLGTWFPTADGFGVRFPDGDLFVRLDPPRRWKRGQKLNRGGRHRARAKHAVSLPGRPPRSISVTVQGGDAEFTLPDGMRWRRAEEAFAHADLLDWANPAQEDAARGLLDEIRQRVFDAPKTPYPEAAFFGMPKKDGGQ